MTQRFAVVSGTPGRCVNIIVAASALLPTWIASTTAQIGDAWDGQQFTAPALDPLSVQATALVAIQQLLDNVAMAHGYDSMERLCSYSQSTHAKWASEGAYGIQYRDACWLAAQSIHDAVNAGQRTLPTVAEVLAEMPAVEWPQ